MLGMGGFQMQTIARTILVDDLTGSAFLTGLVAMGFAPTMLLMSLFGGVAGDRLERRTLIQATQLVGAAIVLVIGILILTGAIHWVHLLVASMAQGATFAFHMPARQAVLPKLVGQDKVTNAIALNSAGMAIMTIIAPAIAGVVYAQVGPEAVYFMIVGLSLLAVLFTGMIPRIPPEVRDKGRNVFGQIASGFEYVRLNRVVLMLLLAGFASSMLAMPFRMQIPVFARRLYGIEASEIGMLMAVMGVGGIVATAVTANMRKGHHRGTILVLVGIGGSGLAVLLMALIPSYTAGLALMVVVGLAGSFRMTLGQSLSIEATDPQYRARVMSLYMMTFGLMPLGALPMGYAVDAVGPTTTMIILGSVLMGVSLLMYTSANSLRNLK
jgi:predicted MFS family arabinose efflux permease